jgi:hypothetical protein
MSLADLKEIDWKHATLNTIPTYIATGFVLIFVGVVLIIIGLFI